eukprot:403348858
MSKQQQKRKQANKAQATHNKQEQKTLVQQPAMAIDIIKQNDKSQILTSEDTMKEAVREKNNQDLSQEQDKGQQDSQVNNSATIAGSTLSTANQLSTNNFQKQYLIMKDPGGVGNEIGGISYSTLRHETTVTTDSALNEEALIIQSSVQFQQSLDDSLELLHATKDHFTNLNDNSMLLQKSIAEATGAGATSLRFRRKQISKGRRVGVERRVRDQMSLDDDEKRGQSTSNLLHNSQNNMGMSVRDFRDKIKQEEQKQQLYNDKLQISDESNSNSQNYDQDSSQGYKIKNEQLKIEEDQLFFDSLSHKTPLDYYDLFNRNQSLLNEEKTYINESQNANKNIFQLQIEEDQDEDDDNIFGRNDYDDNDNINELDRIVADFNHSSSPFLFSENILMKKNSSAMPKTFLDANLFYPDLYESQPIIDLADRRMGSSNNHRNKKKYLNIMNTDHNLNHLVDDFALDIEYNDNQKPYNQTAAEMMMQVAQQEKEMQEIINQIRSEQQMNNNQFLGIEDIMDEEVKLTEKEELKHQNQIEKKYKFRNPFDKQTEENIRTYQDLEIFENEKLYLGSDDEQLNDDDQDSHQLLQDFKIGMQRDYDFEFNPRNLDGLGNYNDENDIYVINDHHARKRRALRKLFEEQHAVSETLNLIENSCWNDETVLRMLDMDEKSVKINQNESKSIKIEDQKSEDDPETQQAYENALKEHQEMLQVFNSNNQLQIDNQYHLKDDEHFKDQQTNLLHLVNYIHGDLYHCAICSSKFEETTNLPRVLFCGDCLCDQCIKDSILPLIKIEEGLDDKIITKQIQCPICNSIHIFKLSSDGYIICNDNFVKLKDEQGLVNLSPELGQQLAYYEINEIPNDLIIRSIPINVELIELIREKKSKENQLSIVQQISKFIQIDQLSKGKAKYYLKELCKICEEDVDSLQLEDEEDILVDSLMNSPVNEKQSSDKSTQFKKTLQDTNLDMFNQIKDKFSNLKPQDLKSISKSTIKALRNSTLQQFNQDILNNSNKDVGNSSAQQLKKSSDETPHKFRQILQNNKNQLLQNRVQNKPFFKQHNHSAGLQGNSVVNHLNQHGHHHHHHHHINHTAGCAHSQGVDNLAYQLLPTHSHLSCKNCAKQPQNNQQQLNGLGMLSKKYQKLIKHHFGPGNNANLVVSRKDFNQKPFTVDNDLNLLQEDEEGLDEREPEKAVCPDHQKSPMHNNFNKIQTLNQSSNSKDLSPNKIRDFNVEEQIRQQIQQLKQSNFKLQQQQQQQQQLLASGSISKNIGQLKGNDSLQRQLFDKNNDILQDSSNKKNKRKKKKRQKAKQQKQEQRMLMKNGIQMDDQLETDLYSMLVPPEDYIQNSKNGGEIQKQALRNPFQEFMPNENIYQMKSLQDQFQGLKDNQLNFPLLCESCCVDFVLAPDALSMNYLSSQQIQIPKLQSQMKKELLEAGILTVISHQCQECLSPSPSSQSVQLSLCLLCSLAHKQKHPNHLLKQVLQKTTLQTIAKKSHSFEQLLNLSVNERVRDTIDKELCKLLTSMRTIFKLPNQSSSNQVSTQQQQNAYIKGFNQNNQANY